MGEQTTLVHNEEEAFALEPLDITTVPGSFSCFFCYTFDKNVCSHKEIFLKIN